MGNCKRAHPGEVTGLVCDGRAAAEILVASARAPLFIGFIGSSGQFTEWGRSFVASEMTSSVSC
jgi:hypothetical protein